MVDTMFDRKSQFRLPDVTSKRLRGYAAFAILTLLLLVHFSLRYAVTNALPLESRHFYPALYNVALSLAGGTGLKSLTLDETIPSHAPVIRFLKLQKASLTADEFAAFMGSRPVRERVTVFAQNRLFEFRVASWLWRAFGISWNVLALFYIAVSTVSCWCVYALCAHLTGQRRGGLLGAALYAVMPCEIGHSVWSIRDANPTWFTIFALTFCLCVAGRFRSRRLNWISYFALGALSLVGLGWRSDALLIPGLTALGLMIALRRDHRGWKHSLAAFLLFAGGILSIYILLTAQDVTHEDFAPAWTTHIAVYADEARTNIGRYEKSYQMLFEDATVSANVYRWLQKPVTYLGAEYARATTEMLMHEASYNMFNWINGFPKIWGRIIWERCGNSYGSFHLAPWPDGKANPPIRAVLGATSFLMQRYWIVVLLAFAGALLVSPHLAEASLLGFFSAYYAALYWLMLPLQKHVTPMSLPAAVAFALAGCVVLASFTRAGRSVATNFLRRRWKKALVSFLLGAAVFLGVREAARWHSTSVRADYLDEIQRRFGKGLAADDSIAHPQKARLGFAAGPLKKDRGYCWEISTDGRGGILALWMRRPINSSRSLFAIPEGQRKVFFYSTCTQFLTGSVVDTPLDVVVTLPPGAKFESCRRFELDGWKTLPFSTVFYPGQRAPGSPRLIIDVPISAPELPPGGWEHFLASR